MNRDKFIKRKTDIILSRYNRWLKWYTPVTHYYRLPDSIRNKFLHLYCRKTKSKLVSIGKGTTDYSCYPPIFTPWKQEVYGRFAGAIIFDDVHNIAGGG